MAANLNVFKTSKKHFIFTKSNFSFAEVHWVIHRIRQDMGTLSAIGFAKNVNLDLL